MAYEIIKGAIAASGDKQDIPLVQDAGTPNRMSFALGFPQITSEDKDLGGLPPRRADLNQALYLVTNNLYEFQGGNFPTFNASALTYLPNGGYPLGAILWCAAEGRFLISTVADNTDNFITTPTIIGTSWKFLNDKEVSDCAVGLLLAASTTNVTVGTGFVKSATTGRILNLTSSLSVLWTTIQTNSSITAAANTRYNLFLAYNPTNTTYTILCADYGTFVPTLPTGYVDYGYIGYLSTNNNSAINNIFPQEMDVHQWYRSGGVNADKLARFCVNSGNIDTNGKGDLMSVSGSVVTWKVGNTYPDIVCTPANGLVSFTLSTINNFDASTLADGTYVLCINKNGVISSHHYIEGNLTYATQKEPASPASGQIWLNMSVSPLNAYQYNGSIWIPFYKVPLGVITVESGSITTYYTLPFNRYIESFEREFVSLNTTVAQGGASIAGTYTLNDLPNDGKIRLALFSCTLKTTQLGSSSMELSSDVFSSSNPFDSLSTNNEFSTAGMFLLPVKRELTISFPDTRGGIGLDTRVILLGYL